jgi:hypothetical protein
MNRFCCVFLPAFCLAALCAHSPAETLTFDDLTTPLTLVPSGYDGFNFTNFYVDTPAGEKPSGYINGTVSPTSVIFNGYGLAASLASDDNSAFTLNSFFLTAAIDDNLTVTVEGLLNNVVLDTAVYNVSTFGPTLETLEWSGINEVSFASSGGTPDPIATTSGYQGIQFVLDNIKVNASPVPEPGAIGLLATGLVSLAAVRRRSGTRA